MKTILAVAIICSALVAHSHSQLPSPPKADAGTVITREEAATIKGLDLETLEKNEHELEGKIVRLKFNYRGKSVTKKDDGSLEGTLHLFRSNYAVWEH